MRVAAEGGCATAARSFGGAVRDGHTPRGGPQVCGAGRVAPPRSVAAGRAGQSPAVGAGSLTMSQYTLVCRIFSMNSSKSTGLRMKLFAPLP